MGKGRKKGLRHKRLVTFNFDIFKTHKPRKKKRIKK